MFIVRNILHSKALTASLISCIQISKYQVNIQHGNHHIDEHLLLKIASVFWQFFASFCEKVNKRTHPNKIV